MADTQRVITVDPGLDVDVHGRKLGGGNAFATLVYRSEAITMRIETQRFGTLQVDEQELFLFPQGLIGLETLRQWLLVPDPENPSVAWLQSASRGDRALAMISPRMFVPQYRVHVAGHSLGVLQMRSDHRTYVLTTLSGKPGTVTTNLRAPVIINLDRRLGCQVVTGDDQPVQYALPAIHSMNRRMAA